MLFLLEEEGPLLLEEDGPGLLEEEYHPLVEEEDPRVGRRRSPPSCRRRSSSYMEECDLGVRIVLLCQKQTLCVWRKKNTIVKISFRLEDDADHLLLEEAESGRRSSSPLLLLELQNMTRGRGEARER